MYKVSIAIASAFLTFTASAGPLDPPGGPVSPTMKTLQQVEPRTPINAETCPGDGTSLYRIIVPGSYYLTSNVDAPDDRHAIKIETSGVTLDLSGFTVTGVTGVSTILATNGHTTVRNGRIRLGSIGLRLQGTHGHVENVRVESCDNSAILVGHSSTVRNCSAWFAGDTGVSAGEHSLIDGCNIDSVGLNGINVGASSIITASTVRSVGGPASSPISTASCATAPSSAAGSTACSSAPARS